MLTTSMTVSTKKSSVADPDPVGSISFRLDPYHESDIRIAKIAGTSYKDQPKITKFSYLKSYIFV